MKTKFAVLIGVALLALGIVSTITAQPQPYYGYQSIPIVNSAADYTNRIATGTRYQVQKNIPALNVTGTKYVAFQAKYECTTASTSNRFGILLGFNVDGSTNVTATTTLTFPATTGTTPVNYTTNVAISGYPYVIITGITNDNGLAIGGAGGAGYLTNYTVKAMVQ